MISVTLGTFALLLANVDFNATLIGLVLVLLVVALFFVLGMKANSREDVSIVRTDPPLRRPGDPAFIRRRGHAAAAALVLHRKRQCSGKLDENR